MARSTPTSAGTHRAPAGLAASSSSATATRATARNGTGSQLIGPDDVRGRLGCSGLRGLDRRATPAAATLSVRAGLLEFEPQGQDPQSRPEANNRGHFEHVGCGCRGHDPAHRGSLIRGQHGPELPNAPAGSLGRPRRELPRWPGARQGLGDGLGKLARPARWWLGPLSVRLVMSVRLWGTWLGIH